MPCGRRNLYLHWWRLHNSLVNCLLLVRCWGEASMSEHLLSIFLKNIKMELSLSQPSLMSCWAGKGDSKMSALGSDQPRAEGIGNFPTPALGFQKSLTFQCGWSYEPTTFPQPFSELFSIFSPFHWITNYFKWKTRIKFLIYYHF